MAWTFSRGCGVLDAQGALCRGFLHQRNLTVQGLLHPGHSYARDSYIQVILTSWDSYIRVFLRPGILTSEYSYVQGFLHSGVRTMRRNYVQRFLNPGVLTSRGSYVHVLLRLGVITSKGSYIHGFLRSEVLTSRAQENDINTAIASHSHSTSVILHLGHHLWQIINVDFKKRRTQNRAFLSLIYKHKCAQNRNKIFPTHKLTGPQRLARNSYLRARANL